MSPIRHSSRGSVLRVMVWAVSIVLLLGIGALTGFDWFLRQKYEPTLGTFRKDVTDKVGFFCEQQVKLAADPWFHEPRTEGDAGPLLNAWLPWDPSPKQPQDSPLVIPAHLPQTGPAFKDWLTSDLDVSTLDFSWMGRLYAYDRWDILQNSPIPLAQRFNWATLPIPNFIPLQLWAKFRLLHGLRTGKPVEAAKDVRHLAWLAYRTDMLLGGAIAAALLQLERQAYDSMQAPPADWHPMSLEQVARMRALVMSGPAFSQLSAPLEVARQARSCGEPVVTRCSALAEASSYATYLKPLAKDKYREIYEAFATEFAERPCATSFSQTLWERGVTVLEEHPDKILQGQVEWPDNLPTAFVGSHILGIVLAVGAPGLKQLKAFQAELDSGSFQKPKP
jgi:hypothetical protein